MNNNEITPNTMYLSRRDILKAAGIFTGSALLAACAPKLLEEPTVEPDPITPTPENTATPENTPTSEIPPTPEIPPMIDYVKHVEAVRDEVARRYGKPYEEVLADLLPGGGEVKKFMGGPELLPYTLVIAKMAVFAVSESGVSQYWQDKGYTKAVLLDVGTPGSPMPATLLAGMYNAYDRYIPMLMGEMIPWGPDWHLEPETMSRGEMEKMLVGSTDFCFRVPAGFSAPLDATEEMVFPPLAKDFKTAGSVQQQMRSVDNLAYQLYMDALMNPAGNPKRNILFKIDEAQIAMVDAYSGGIEVQMAKEFMIQYLLAKDSAMNDPVDPWLITDQFGRDEFSCNY